MTERSKKLANSVPPFEGGTIEILSAHLGTAPRPLSAVKSDVPPDLEQVIDRCMVKDRDHRFASAAELRAALDGCAAAGEWNEERAAAWWR